MTQRQTIALAMLLSVVIFLLLEQCSHAHAQAASQPTLIGTWYLQSFDNKYFDSGTIVVLTLRSDGGYALTTFIHLINGNMGSETELGKFRREGHAVRFVPVSSTCTKHNHNQRVVNYVLATKTLVLRGKHKDHVFRRNIVFNEATIVMQLNASLTPPIQGCFDVEHRRFTFTE